MTVALWVLAVSVAIVVYSYAGYPALLWLAGRGRRAGGETAEPAQWPEITICVPAYNEEGSIARTLDALTQLDYPADKRHILVISDASTDRTDAIVGQYAAQGVELLRMPVRGGKTAAENAARSRLRGDILLNTDASVRLDRACLKPLVAALMADPTVGVASGRDVSVANVESPANVGESGYVGYEMWVRRLETAVDGIVGASGCLYAIRRLLHNELVPSALSRDFASALIAREHGLRAVSVDAAVCYVPRTPSLRREYRRKVRTMARGMETLWYKRRLLNPFAYGRFAWMLWSHKVLRWLVPWALVAGGVATAVLATAWSWAVAALAVGLLVLAAGGIGWLWPEERPMPRLLAMPAYAVSSTIAALSASIKAMRGELNPIWEPTRRGGAPS